MTHHHARTDANHRKIVEALREHGASVQSLADLGHGCPDVLVGFAGRNYLIEIKDGKKPPSAQRLTLGERRFVISWRGQVAVVRSVDDALSAVGINKNYRFVLPPKVLNGDAGVANE